MKIYRATGYSRASKDEKDSDTIQNQWSLIRQYVDGQDDIEIVSERSDDGYSGVDFDRPDFERMVADIKAGLVDCVIVKDLSRLGRNYIEVGEVMEKLFPFLGVRLIAVNDNYDSSRPRTDADDYVIPFKNLINETYLRDTSIKIRSNLEVSRRNGSFVAPITSYGYVRSAEDKHRLEIAPYAAKIVREIFRLFIAGHSCNTIAEQLNKACEPSPAEYKRQQGEGKYKTNFQVRTHALWAGQSVRRILQNPIYIGTLIQGKRSSPNYKVKKVKAVDESDWAVTQDSHDAIISKEDFETVQQLLLRDVRKTSDSETVQPLSGYLVCADCGGNLIRKKVGKYYYFVCGTNKGGNGCTSHSISEKELFTAVFSTIQLQIGIVLDMERSIRFLRSLSLTQNGTARLNAQIADREAEKAKTENYKRSLYEDLKDGTIDREDFRLFNEEYTKRLNELEESIEHLRSELALIDCGSELPYWMTSFISHKNVEELSRQLVVHLIDRITVYEGKRIEVIFRFEDSIKRTQQTIQDIEIARKEETDNGTKEQEARRTA